MSMIFVVSQVLLTVIIVIGFAVVAALYEIHADIRRRLGPRPDTEMDADGLPIGSAAPRLEGYEARSGKPVGLTEFLGRTVLVVIVGPGSEQSIRLAPHLNRFAKRYAYVPMIVVCLNDKGFDFRPALTSNVTLIMDQDVRIEEAYTAKRTPLAYVIAPDGTIGARSAPHTLFGLQDVLAGFGERQGADPLGGVATAELESPTR